MSYALDTNVLARYIVQDDKAQAKKAAKVIEALQPETPAFISCIVLCELNWVLQSGYKVSKEERVSALQGILTASVFAIERLEICLKALRLYEVGQADYSDYLIQQIAKQEGYGTVLTFDKNAQKSDGFQSP
jgi:predicted nucleic-acid-binding protein